MRLLLAILLTAGAACAQTARPPITAEGRLKWAAVSTLGVPNLTGAAFTTAFATAYNRPKEYGTHWDGYGKRYGMKIAGSATSSLLEAGLGSLWGEDPRYYRAGSGESPGRRLKSALKQAFVAHDRDGKTVPAYARYMAVPSSNFLSNTWRPDSQANASGALIRTGLGFAARITSNMFNEFWPDIVRR